MQVAFHCRSLSQKSHIKVSCHDFPCIYKLHFIQMSVDLCLRAPAPKISQKLNRSLSKRQIKETDNVEKRPFGVHTCLMIWLFVRAPAPKISREAMRTPLVVAAENNIMPSVLHPVSVCILYIYVRVYMSCVYIYTCVYVHVIMFVCASENIINVREWKMPSVLRALCVRSLCDYVYMCACMWFVYKYICV